MGAWMKSPKSGTADQAQNYNHFTGVDYDAGTETNAIFRVSLPNE
jgi:hypothetical protein